MSVTKKTLRSGEGIMVRATIVIAAFAVLGFAATAAAEETTLRVGAVPSAMRGVSSLPFFIGEREGFFAHEGLKLERVPVEGGTDKMVKAVDAGDVAMAETATPYFIQAVLAGSPSVAVAALTANPIYSLIVRPGIKSFDDLKGKTLGLSLAVDTISISMRKLLALKGLKATDYQVKELVGTPVRFDCLKKGDCDGVPLGQPEDFNAIAQGFGRLGVSTEAIANFEFTVIVTRRDWAESHKPVVTGFVRSMANSFRFIRDPANREAVAQAIVASSGTSAETARAILALYFEPERGVMPKAAELDLKGLSQVIAFMGEGGILPAPLPSPERFVDFQYLRAAGVR
jgi:ABC-type nitrate/sulfonate/bicarbonate transport system substrate-binding protein